MAEVYTDKDRPTHHRAGSLPNWIWIALLAVVALLILIAVVR